MGGRQPSVGVLGAYEQVRGRPLSRHLATAFGVVLLVTCVLAGCSASDDDPPEADPASSPTTEAAMPTPARAAPPPPPLRACYALAYDEAVAPTNDRRDRPCDREHTSVTFFVGELDTVVDGHLLAVDSKQVQAQVATACPLRFAEFVGGTPEQRRLSMLRSVWFTPSVEESDKGANWFRCDVIAVAADGKLAPLSGRMEDVLAREADRDRYAMCGTAAPDQPNFRRVICSSDHSWRAISTVTFEAASYPGVERARAAGETPCEDAGRAVADDALNFRWGYEWPSRKQWASGQTYGICWAPD